MEFLIESGLARQDNKPAVVGFNHRFACTVRLMQRAAMKGSVLCLSLLALCTSCDHRGHNPYSRCEGLRHLSLESAEQDASTAKSRGDARLLMIGGLVGEVPEARDNMGDARMIEGTTDHETPECRGLRSKAVSYAQRYNRKMVRLTFP